MKIDKTVENKKKVFEEIIQEEKTLYLEDKVVYRRKTLHKRYIIWKFLYYYRMCVYLRLLRNSEDVSVMKKRVIKRVFWLFDRMRNKYGEKAGIEIGLQCNIGKRCDIWHSGVVINGNVGDGCTFRGNNLLGEKGGRLLSNATPTLGNRVDVGFGAVIIGGIHIADDCIIGAGSVVTKNFENRGTIIAGVPARVISMREDL